jgi:dATP pyrophosphohydrolase
MPRAPYNVLVIPYRRGAASGSGDDEFAVFHRADGEMWQFIAGGGEDDETPAVAARREAREEGGIDLPESAWTALDSHASIARTAFPGAPWPDDVYVVTEHCFAVDVGARSIELSHEHDACQWLRYPAARDRLIWDSNRNALWELTRRFERNDL